MSLQKRGNPMGGGVGEAGTTADTEGAGTTTEAAGTEAGPGTGGQGEK